MSKEAHLSSPSCFSDDASVIRYDVTCDAHKIERWVFIVECHKIGSSASPVVPCVYWPLKSFSSKHGLDRRSGNFYLFNNCVESISAT